MRVANYFRVSTDNQESEGTSLQTQLEACKEYCQKKGYEIIAQFSEAYSGLTLDRPKLNEIRELVRSGDIDVLVVYSLDRLSRDPTHGVILTQELEKHGVKLEAVSETIESSELGKLINYIRGFASKLEAEKIRERTLRGRRARALEGRMSGGFHTTYGYDYVKVSQKDGGRRAINETEAKWVRDMFHWLVVEGLSTNAITYRLRALNVPAKSGGIWRRGSVQTILKNPAYTGKTYAFTAARTRPQSEWIEIPGVTPPIISKELFDAAQRQLQVNREQSLRNCKREYLLRGHIKCRQCGRSYVGAAVNNKRGKFCTQSFYRCTGKKKMWAPIERCHNKGWSARRLEGMVWAELERYLSDRDLIKKELKKQSQDANQLTSFEAELERVEKQLKTIDREQHQLLQWALKDFPANHVETENRRINKTREVLKAHKSELETQIKAGRDATINIPKLESFIERMQAGIAKLDFEGKRQALDMLNIIVWLDGESVEVTGAIEPEDAIVITHSCIFVPFPA